MLVIKLISVEMKNAGMSQNSIRGSSHKDILIGFPAVNLISKNGKKGKTN